jgi:hypothetical protein
MRTPLAPPPMMMTDICNGRDGRAAPVIGRTLDGVAERLCRIVHIDVAHGGKARFV